MKEHTADITIGTEIVPKEANTEYLKGFIYDIRGVRVMLDMDLAKIYGYSTKDFNRQVKNNIEKFEQDFRFQLTDEECEILRCKNSTSNWGGRRYNPYAFTEQGIYMLMTVLKGPLATRQSKSLIRIFKQMKDYIIENQPLLGQREYLQLSLQTTQNTQEHTADERIYHCGASSKDGGNKVTTITAVTDGAVYHPVIEQLIQNPPLTLR